MARHIVVSDAQIGVRVRSIRVSVGHGRVGTCHVGEWESHELVRVEQIRVRARQRVVRDAQVGERECHELVRVEQIRVRDRSIGVRVPQTTERMPISRGRRYSTLAIRNLAVVSAPPW
jgi:hypothetical protein